MRRSSWPAVLPGCAALAILGLLASSVVAAEPPREPEPRLLVALLQDCLRCGKPLHPLRFYVQDNGAVQSHGRDVPMHYYPLEPAQLQTLKQLMARPEWQSMTSQPAGLEETRFDVRTADFEIVGARGVIVQKLYTVLLSWDQKNRQPEQPPPIMRRFSRCDNCYVGTYQDMSIMRDGRIRFRSHGRIAISPPADKVLLDALQALLSDPRWDSISVHRLGKYDEQETFLEARGKRVSDFSHPLVVEIVKALDVIESAAAPPRWF